MQKSGPEKRRLASAIRSLCARLAKADPGEELFRGAAEAIKGWAERLADSPRRSRHVGYYERAGHGGGPGFDFGLADLSPVSGAANPVAPPLRVEHLQKGHAVGSAAFPAFYGTRSGTVRNGYLAAALDEVLVSTPSPADGTAGPDILKIRYRSPCPLNTELCLESRVHKRREEGRIVVRATMHAGGRLVADGEKTFGVSERQR